MDTNLQPGQMLGSYRIISQIGQGGMATVYKAYQPSMDRNVAVKILPGQLAQSEEFAARFRQEARIIAKLEHPHILPVFDYGESDGVSYFVMRYLEAGTLKTKMETGPLSWNEIDNLFTQLAEALGYAHSRGVIHRDLKPGNALVDEDGNLFLTDFGIAKILESASPRLTQTDAIMGTPAYISPEQAKAIKVDQRSDIYSLGIILYEMVTGRVPFTADTPLAVILKHVSDPLPPPSVIKSNLPNSIERVILKALAKEPNDRYATASEFLDAWKLAMEDRETVRRAPDRTSIPASHMEMPPAQAQGRAVPASGAVPKSGNSTVWIIGCGVLACLLISVGGIAIFGGSTFLSFLNQPTDEPVSIATELISQPTEIPLPEVTNVPVSSGEILLEDDFSDTTIWGTLTDSDNSVEYQGEALRMQIFQQNWFVWSTPGGDTYSNIHMEITVTNNDGESTTSYGLICNKQGDISSYYYLAMASDGEYVIGRIIDGADDAFLTNDNKWAYSDLIETDLSTYRIGADCGNGAFTLYVNDQQIASVTDDTFTEGGVGIFAWSGANVSTADVTFDDFIITSLK
jgi:tRNA A-37 threonylcarbamoyl transferase component Bud32